MLAPDRLLALRRVATIESIGSSTRIDGSARNGHIAGNALRRDGQLQVAAGIETNLTFEMMDVPSALTAYNVSRSALKSLQMSLLASSMIWLMFSFRECAWSPSEAA